MRCLVVDDDELGRRMLAAFLAESYTCDLAADGQEALDLVDQAWSAGKPYDFICLDIVMPVMDGSAALRQIRERDQQQGRRRTKVFMISACSTPQDIEDAFFEGDCDDYVVKPFQREAIAQMLIRHKLS
ncbi:MAG: response regulator [Geobacter sp.]|jgi:two-component system chemotaxis response regulator CheY|nr:response regulator [Geobacter sp.]